MNSIELPHIFDRWEPARPVLVTRGSVSLTLIEESLGSRVSALEPKA